MAYFKGWEGLTDVAANVARASNDIESALVVNSNAVDFANRITFTPVPLVIYVALYAGVPFVIMLIIQISCCLCCCCRIPRCAGLCVPNKPVCICLLRRLCHRCCCAYVCAHMHVCERTGRNTNTNDRWTPYV